MHLTSIRWPLLLTGALLTGILGLSVHVVMLQLLHIPYPAGFPHTGIGAWLNTAPSVFAAILLYTLASDTFLRYSPIPRVLALFLLLTMLQEQFFRAPIMNSVVTTAWTFSFLSNIPTLLVWLLLSILIVALAPLLKNLWLKLVAAVALYALVFLVCRPAIAAAFNPILQHVSYLAHDEVYGLPYGLHVLLPAYLTYAEPVAACIVIAALLWKPLDRRLPMRLLQFTLLILAIRHVLFAPLIFPFFSRLPVPTAFLSIGQFSFEAIALAVFSALTWHLSRRSPLPDTLPSIGGPTISTDDPHILPA